MKTNKKEFAALVVILIVLALAGTGLYFYFQQKTVSLSAPAAENVLQEVTPKSESGVDGMIEVFDKYDVFGMAEFSTIVEGYYREHDDIFEADENGVPVIAGRGVDLVILNFKDNDFKESLAKTPVVFELSKGGNYIFDFGRIVNGKIWCDNYIDNTVCIDDATATKIRNSTPQKPVSVELFFGKHDFPVDNLAYRVQMVKFVDSSDVATKTEIVASQQKDLEGQAEKVQLANGTMCVFLGGATAVNAKNERMNYGCGDVANLSMVIYGDLTEGTVWKANVSNIERDAVKKEWIVISTKTVDIAKLWR